MLHCVKRETGGGLKRELNIVQSVKRVHLAHVLEPDSTAENREMEFLSKEMKGMPS